jgi:hypothetical protein
MSGVYDPIIHMENPDDQTDESPGDQTDNDDLKKNDEEYKTNKSKLDDDISSKRNVMMYSNESIGTIRMKNVDDYPYVDTDNYRKYLGLKQKTDFISLMVEQLFWIAYLIVIIYFLYIEFHKFFGKFNSLMTEETTNPNWGMLLSPVIIYTIYKSFQEYSFSKNIF